jgi:hypothetical protein
VGVLAAAVAIATPANAAAEPSTFVGRSAFDVFQFNPCNDHVLHLQGGFLSVTHITTVQRPDGSSVFVAHNNLTAQGANGVDVTTGTPVHWILSQPFTEVQFQPGQQIVVVGLLIFKYVLPGPNNDVVTRAQGVTVIDADGTVRVNIGGFVTTCGA